MICQKKALRIICLQPPNSTISLAFENLKIMPVDMLFRFCTSIFSHTELKQSLIINHNKNTPLNNQAFKLPIVKTEKGKRSIFYHTAELHNLLVWDFIAQPTKTFREGLAALLREQDRLAECRAGRVATDLPASLAFYVSRPGPSLL